MTKRQTDDKFELKPADVPTVNKSSSGKYARTLEDFEASEHKSVEVPYGTHKQSSIVQGFRTAIARKEMQGKIVVLQRGKQVFLEKTAD